VQRRVLRIEIPESQEAGAYSNTLAVWHSPHEFTLDFAVRKPEQTEEDGTVMVPCLVTARVRLPVSVMFDVLRALNSEMTRYEDAFGEIVPPEPRSPDE
jgi:hypothetical protein